MSIYRQSYLPTAFADETTFLILTIPVNESMNELHDRIPVIVGVNAVRLPPKDHTTAIGILYLEEKTVRTLCQGDLQRATVSHKGKAAFICMMETEAPIIQSSHIS